MEEMHIIVWDNSDLQHGALIQKIKSAPNHCTVRNGGAPPWNTICLENYWVKFR